MKISCARLTAVRKGNRVDEIVLNLEAAGYLQSIFEKLREKNRTNYEIYVSVTLYDIPTRLVARHYHITENNVNNRVMRTRRWLARRKAELLILTVALLFRKRKKWKH